MSVLGTYSPEAWGGEHLLPDYGKIVLGDSTPVPMEELFPDATAAARDLIASMLSCAPASPASSTSSPARAPAPLSRAAQHQASLPECLKL